MWMDELWFEWVPRRTIMNDRWLYGVMVRKYWWPWPVAWSYRLGVALKGEAQ